MKALSRVMRYRVAAECFFRVTGKGLLEAVTLPEIQTYRRAFQAQGTEGVQRPRGRKGLVCLSSRKVARDGSIRK